MTRQGTQSTILDKCEAPADTPLSAAEISTAEREQRLMERADGIHRFPAKMAIRLARRFFESFDASRLQGLRFYDPFCGSGTTALVARRYGLNVRGGELHPMNATVARAKLTRLSMKEIEELRTWFLPIRGAPRQHVQAESKWWQSWYHSDTFASLERLRDRVLDVEEPRIREALTVAVSQTAWDVSGADPDVMVPTHSTASPTNPEYTPREVHNAFKKRLERILRAQAALRALNFATETAAIKSADAKDRRSWPHNVDIILTSPPYGISLDYNRAASLQGRLFLEAPILEKCRGAMLGRLNRFGNQRDILKHLPDQYQNQSWIKAMGDYEPRRFAAFCAYLGDLRRVFENAKQRIVDDGCVGIVLGNPESNGHEVPLVQIVQQLAIDSGWNIAGKPMVDVIRKRFQAGVRRSSTRPIGSETLTLLRRD